MTWALERGVVELPSGVRLRGRGRRTGGSPDTGADWTLFLLGNRPVVTQTHRWVRWPDFWLPADRAEARSAFLEAYSLAAAGQRVEVACGGGIGRTGTALACIAQLDGVAAADATGWVRAHYHRRAVETPWQRRYVRRFSAPAA